MAQAIVIGQSGGGKIVPRLPTYSGQSTIYGDEKKGYMELLTNGDLTFNSPLTIDLFLVGGGGSGEGDYRYFGGGGGGYTGTWLAQTFNKNQKAAVSIGMGSQNTSVDGGKYSVNCGGNAASSTGGAGGSGGGEDGDGYTGGAGGSNGSNGGGGGGRGGLGQAKTTKPFYGDVVPFASMLFSGGGGGGGGSRGSGENRQEGTGGAGGSGGGGKGSDFARNNGAPGVPNTGGGGGSGKSGGSGIVIIRWGY